MWHWSEIPCNGTNHEIVSGCLLDKVSNYVNNLLSSFSLARVFALNQNSSPDKNSEPALDQACADQGDASKIDGKSVVLAVNQEDESQAFSDVFAEMKLRVQYASSGAEILRLLEDHPVHLLVMDMEMPDIHAWKMISKVREIEMLRDLPILVITDQASLGMTVAKVDYLTRPVSIARLRQNIAMTLNQGDVSDDSASLDEC